MSPTARPWRGFEAFDALAPEWDACASAAELDPLCNSHAWVGAYAHAFARDEDVFGWRFEQDGALLGVLALRREPVRGPLALRRALFLADGTFDSDYLEPPVRPGHERVVAQLLVEAARNVRGLEALVLAGLPDSSRFLRALRNELERRELPRREHTVPCLAAELGDSFEAYVAALKPRMRSKLRSAARAARASGARLDWVGRADELAPALEELYRLHELRWRAEQKSGSFHDARRRAFYHELCTHALAQGTLRFARLVRAERTLAAQLGIRLGTRYYQIQEGFDPALDDERVGTALRALALEVLIGEGVRSYDFMAGDSRHKREWGGVPRPCTTIAFPLPRWRAKLAYRLREQLARWRAQPAPAPSPLTGN